MVNKFKFESQATNVLIHFKYDSFAIIYLFSSIKKMKLFKFKYQFLFLCFAFFYLKKKNEKNLFIIT